MGYSLGVLGGWKVETISFNYNNMTSIKKLFALALLATGIAAPAMAQESSATEKDYKPFPHMFIGIQGGGQIQVMPGKIRFDLLVHDGRLAAVDHVHFFRHNIHRIDLLMLGKKNGNGQAHIACAGDCNDMFHNVDSLPYLFIPSRASLFLRHRARR